MMAKPEMLLYFHNATFKNFWLEAANDSLGYKVLDNQSRGPVFKTIGSKADSVFYPSKVDKMCTRNFWELGGKK